MKKILTITVTAVLLLACTASPPAAANIKSARAVAEAGSGRVYRFCDSGRLVYVFQAAYNSGGIAVSDLPCDVAD